MTIARLIPFIILTTLLIPSVLCYTFIFIQSIRKRILCRHIPTHIILVVLMCCFLQVTTELPILLAYLHNGIAVALTDGFCKFWAWQDYSFNVMILMLAAHTAIERYLLVFYNAFFRRHLLILHYLPIIFCCIYPLLLYIYLIIIHSCTNQFNYTMVTCGGPCYYYEPALSTFDQFANLVLPVVVSSLVSLILLIRVVRQKRRMQQQQMWRKNRRLVIQLLYVVILHNIVWLPMIICSTIMFFGTLSQSILLDLAVNILPIGIYVVILLHPFSSLLSLPKLWPQIRGRITLFTVRPNIVLPTQQLPALQNRTVS